MVYNVCQNRKEALKEIGFYRVGEIYSSRFLAFCIRKCHNISKIKKNRQIVLVCYLPFMMLGELKMETPKETSEQFYYIMRPNETARPLMTFSEAIQLKQSQELPLAGFFNLVDIACFDAHEICYNIIEP